MSEKRLYVLAGYDDATEEKLVGWQQKVYDAGFIGTHTKNLPQHITLGSFPVETEAELVESVRKIAAENSRFMVTFNHVGIFGGSKVLFIAPDVNHELLNLKELFGSSEGWTPHTTMLIDEPSRIYEVLPIVAGNFQAFAGEVTTLHVYEFWPTRNILTVNLR